MVNHLHVAEQEIRAMLREKFDMTPDDSDMFTGLLARVKESVEELRGQD